MTDESTPPTNAAEPEPGKPGGKFAVYDLTLTRFVSGVFSSKAEATKAAKAMTTHDYEVRAV